MAGNLCWRKQRSKAGDFFCRQRYIRCRHVFLKIGDFCRTGDRNDKVTLRQNPGQRQLPGGNTLFGSHVFQKLDECEIGIEVFTLEARQAAAEIVGCKSVERLQRARQGTTPERAEGDETDAKFAAGFQHAVFLHIAGPQRIFALYGSDRVSGMRLAKCFGTRFR